MGGGRSSPVPLDGVAAALDLGLHELVAVVGGGGKSTLVHALGGQLTGSVVVTTTTKMGSDQDEGRAVLLAPDDEALAGAVGGEPVVVWSSIDGSVARGVAPEACDHYFGLVDHVVVEADGSKRRPFKAPADHEPVIPSASTWVLSTIGAGALGLPIATACHRPEIVASLTGLDADDVLTPEAAAIVIVGPGGSLARRPSGARGAVVIANVRPGQHLAEHLRDELTLRAPDLPVLLVSHDERR